MTWMYGAPIVFIVMGCLLACWFISDTEKKLFRTPIDKYFALFFVMFVISTRNAGWLYYTLEMVTETFKIALIYWFIITIVNSEERLKVATWTIVLLMSVVGLMGVLQTYGYDITGAGMYWASDKQVWQIKGVGLFDNPNDMAYSVVLIVPFVIGLFLVSSNLLVKLSAVVIFFIATYCIFLTNSRGGYLALCMSCVTWVYFWISSRNLRRMAFVLGLIGVIAAFSFQTSNYREDKSSMGRVEAWAEGMDMLIEHPLIGVGKGQFREHHKLDSHSSYVRAGAELGIIGLYAFIGILYSSILILMSGDKEVLLSEDHQASGKNWKLYRIGFISYICSYCVASIFSSRSYDIVFMIIIALTSVLCRLTVDLQAKKKLSDIAVNKGIWNKKVMMLTLFTLIIWKIFLIQVW